MGLEIGGFFGLESCPKKLHYKEGVAFNSGRSALRYLARSLNVKEIFIPDYTCPVVYDALIAEGCVVHAYEVDMCFLPVSYPHTGAFVLYNNYFGVCGNQVDVMAKKYKNLITDNAQSFYSPHIGIGSFFSPRKFFGVADGGYASPDFGGFRDYPQGFSCQRAGFLLNRIDYSASSSYNMFLENEKMIASEGVNYMSSLTASMLGSIDYEFVARKRTENFKLLDSCLGHLNGLQLNLAQTDIPMVYPFLSKISGLREKLIKNKIFIPVYWKDLKYMKGLAANTFRDFLLPLPIDQRYGKAEMEKIVSVINE